MSDTALTSDEIRRQHIAAIHKLWEQHYYHLAQTTLALRARLVENGLDPMVYPWDTAQDNAIWAILPNTPREEAPNE